MTFHLAWGKNSWFNLSRATCELGDLESLTVTVDYNPSLRTPVRYLAKTTQTWQPLLLLLLPNP